jgi:hypothetical protein
MRLYSELSISELNRVYMETRLAIERGILVKPNECEYDNCSVATRLEIHHEDYDQPLKIKWLCKKHHNQAQKEMNKNRQQNYPKDRIKIFPDNYQQNNKPKKFMAHFPDICYCKECKLKRQEKTWARARLK